MEASLRAPREKQERREYVFRVVKQAIDIYVGGVTRDYGSMFSMGLIGKADWDARHEQIAKLLFEEGMKLGGVSLKSMQFMSLRNDFQESYKKYFSKAQEEATTSPIEHVLTQLKGVVHPVINLQQQPFKSASISQVHQGQLENGTSVVVKVQHPGIKDLFVDDLQLLADVGVYCDTYKEAQGAAVMLQSIASKLQGLMTQELDFRAEAASQRRIREGLAQNGHAIVPQVFDDSDTVLVMEMLPHVTCTEAMKELKAGRRPELLTEAHRDNIFEAYATMLFKLKFTQADAHPGNIMVSASNDDIALLDFGQCVEVLPETYFILRRFVENGPSTQQEIDDADRMKSLMATLGIQASRKQAVNVAKLLCFGQGKGLFPQIDYIKEDIIPLLIIILYLSRLESTASTYRLRHGFNDRHDPFAVMKSFKKVIHSLDRADNSQLRKFMFFYFKKNFQ
jgi:predicted unusual protein kinase regulating ubiquinone biosynthesis (AarF/ABC1/UbiB family)